MIAQDAQSAALNPIKTSTGVKLLNVLATPGLVFDEVATAPPKTANWVVPLILVCLSGTVLLELTTSPEQTRALIAPLLDNGQLNQDQAATLSAHWKSVSRIAIGLSACAGTFWSALVLWFIGRVFLKSRFGFLKALEVVGLSGAILVVGTIVTGLLIAATGDASARPALSLFCGKLQPDSWSRSAAGMIDGFHLWTIAVLTIGLSKLGSVTIKEAAFWVVGYWLFVRTALALLS
jgi:hypothetical protein